MYVIVIGCDRIRQTCTECTHVSIHALERFLQQSERACVSKLCARKKHSYDMDLTLKEVLRVGVWQREASANTRNTCELSHEKANVLECKKETVGVGQVSGNSAMSNNGIKIK